MPSYGAAGQLKFNWAVTHRSLVVLLVKLCVRYGTGDKFVLGSRPGQGLLGRQSEGPSAMSSGCVVIVVLGVKWPLTALQLSQPPVGCVQSLPAPGAKVTAKTPSLATPRVSSRVCVPPHGRFVSVRIWNGVIFSLMLPAPITG